jgi:hypothetical protein
MLAQLLAAADSAGLTASLHTSLPDATVTALVGADGVHEWPVAVVALGGTPALTPAGPAAAGEVDAAPVEFPLVTAAQRAGDCGTLGSPWDRGDPVDVPVLAADPAVEAVVLSRGSQRRMDRARGLPASLLRTCLRAGLRGVPLPHRVVVHDVDGFAPGVYRWPELSAPVRAGALRDELYLVCLEQALAHDAAFVVVAAAEVGALNDQQYRDAHLAAGLAEGRLHLLAYALGASASGMTFLDSEIPTLLGEPLDALLFTCVGTPQYRSAAGGLPGTPTPIRMVAPRVQQ